MSPRSRLRLAGLLLLVALSARAAHGAEAPVVPVAYVYGSVSADGLVRVSPPARLLAPLQAGGLGGKLKVNAVDAPFDPATDAALAVAEPGRGRVIGVFDRNTFWNAGAGTRLSHADNREFAQRLLLWATRREAEFTPATAAASRAASGDTRELAVNAGPDRRARVGVRIVLEGSVTQGASTQPELSWSVVEGASESVAFDNHNAATTHLGVTFAAPGRHVLEFRATRGSTTARDRVIVTVE